MKNVTVSLDDETYRRARVKAAEAGRSVSSVVRDALRTFAHEETDFYRLKREEMALRVRMKAEGYGLRSLDNISRDALYDERFDRKS